MAQLLADNRLLREGQVRANTYNRHIIKKLEWLMRDAARRREESPEELIAGPSVLPKKRRRVVDSEEEQEKEQDQEEVGEEEEQLVPCNKIELGGFPLKGRRGPLRKLRDLDLSNVEATPRVELRVASPLPPPTLEDVHPQTQSPGTYPPWHIPSWELTPSRPIYTYDLLDPILTDLPGPPKNPLKGHHLVVPVTTRSFPSSVAVPVAPFELQPAPSMLQHKPSYTKIYLKTYSDPGLTLYQALPSPNGLVATKCLRRQRNDLPVPNSNQGSKRAPYLVETRHKLKSQTRLLAPPSSRATASNVRTSKGRQPAVQEPPPVDPGVGQLQRRYASMGYVQNASSPMGGFAYSPTWGTRGPPPGPVPQLDMESASNAGGRVSGQVAAIERIQGESEEPLTSRQQEKLPERRVSPAASEQSRASSRRLPTPPVQSLNPPLPR
ncbi:hypothetical protein EV368DRAFT_88050 [Lentinula lateritia]|nr:hypothetical protein EV368DRAFT_88050 [Lentinula lateritia]